MPSINTSPTSNPHFKNADRAPYELGQLLKQLPTDFLACTQMTRDVLLKASAAADHASNANYTLVSGLEAIGEMMFLAGTNEHNEISPSTISDLGCLIRHIAVELQFLQETQSSLDSDVRDQCGGQGDG